MRACQAILSTGTASGGSLGAYESAQSAEFDGTAWPARTTPGKSDTSQTEEYLPIPQAGRGSRGTSWQVSETVH